MALLAVCGMSAKHLTPQEALSRAMSNQSAGLMKAPATPSMTVSRTILNPDGAAALYVFQGDGNAIVAPADDRVAPVLGYVDNCAQGQIPPQMEWWLHQYARQIDYVMAQPEKGTGLYITLPRKKADDGRAPIDPMVTTRWNQDSPYNYKCPTVGGQKSMTGCVATAAAQVMKYHNYPEEGTGTISYKDGSTTRTLSLTGKKFDWDNMLDSYSGSYNSTQRDAVAFLMQAVGYASQMSYSPEASGAQSPVMVEGVKEYFGYNEEMVMLDRDKFPLAQWEQLIYDNLKTVGPVYYAGSDNIQGGHAFVCDGYSQDGFFHFNWGWGGMYDGYFKLTALTPEGQGIGGNAGGFNFGQEIALNFTKPGAPTIDIALSPITLTGNLTGTRNGSTTITLSSDQVQTMRVFAYNSSSSAVTVELGLKAVSVTTGEEVAVSGTGNPVTLQPDGGYTRMNVPVSADLPNGRYRMYLVAREYPSGQWMDVNHNISSANFVNVTMSGGSISSVSNAAGGELESYDMQLLTSVYIGYPMKLSYALENNSEMEIYDGVMPVVFTLTNGQADIKAIGDAYAADMLPGETAEVETVATMYPYQGSENFKGAAYLGLVSSSTGAILDYVSITVKPAPSSISVTANEFSMVGDRNNADANNLSFNCGITLNSGYWAAPLTIYICTFRGDLLHTLTSSETYFLDPDQSASATVSGSFPGAKEGTTYTAVLGYVSGYYIESIGSINFKVKTPYSGIGENTADTQAPATVAVDRASGNLTVDAPGEIASVEAYTLDGRRHDLDIMIEADHANASLSALPAGMLLVKVTLADGSVTTSKIVK